MRITFLGAAGEVTGSQHLIETDDRRILLDCGLFHGHRAEAYAKNRTFRCRPKDLDAVILSHGHIDHSGNLPGLYRAGFRGPVFCTSATADVTDIMLRDSAKIQAEDARYLRKKLPAGSPAIEPLYDDADVRGIVSRFETLEYHEWHDLAPDVRLRFVDAGHILGSAICELHIQDRGDWKRVVFSGDLGRRGLPLLRDPEPVSGCDVLICESTYGNRVHAPPNDIKTALLRIIREAFARGGRVVIPAFSLGRTQHVVYYLNELTNERLLPDVPIYVDSPLSNRLTAVYRRHTDIMDVPVQRSLLKDSDLFGFRGLTYITSQKESAALNYEKGPMVIISASGMCENGRILHHLRHSIEDERNTVVIIGFQAEHTLGRRIVERQPKLRIYDRFFDLKAQVEVLNGLSAHADALDFRWWIDHMSQDRGIGQAFIVHGEPASALGLAGLLDHTSDEPPIIPQLYESFEV